MRASGGGPPGGAVLDSGCVLRSRGHVGALVATGRAGGGCFGYAPPARPSRRCDAPSGARLPCARFGVARPGSRAGAAGAGAVLLSGAVRGARAGAARRRPGGSRRGPRSAASVPGRPGGGAGLGTDLRRAAAVPVRGGTDARGRATAARRGPAAACSDIAAPGSPGRVAAVIDARRTRFLRVAALLRRTQHTRTLRSNQ